MNPYLKLLRAGNGLISGIGTAAGGLSAEGIWSLRGLSPWMLLALCGLSAFLVTSAGNVLNDVLDIEGDRINHPDRPLPAGQVTPGTALHLSGALFALSPGPILLAVAVGWLPLPQDLGSLEGLLIILAVSVSLLLAYEFRLKATGLPGNVVVAGLTGLVFLFGASAFSRIPFAVPFALMATLASLSRELIKDMEDFRGDVDRVTVPRTWGLPATATGARACIAGAIGLSPLPLLTWLPRSSFGGLAYLILVLAADGVFICSVLWLPRRLHTEQNLSKVAMVIALLAFLGASFR
jgi:geranylgeranylglycerol-phosphate geranylgeranyltransferase